MKIIDYLKNQSDNLTKFEKIFFPLCIMSLIILSFVFNDSKIALINAICGITYTFFAGKGKVFCFYVGILGTFCYCYIAFKNGFFANFSLYLFYYFPMQLMGILRWKKNLQKGKNEIIKTSLKQKEKILYFLIALFLTFVLYFILLKTTSKSPFIDSTTTIFSILGLYLTVKRCIEQWYIWFLVNVLTFIMWLGAYLNGFNCLNTVIMWLIYVFFSVYFLVEWKKSLSNQRD